MAKHTRASLVKPLRSRLALFLLAANRRGWLAWKRDEGRERKADYRGRQRASAGKRKESLEVEERALSR